MRACKPDAPRQTVTLWIAAGEVHGGVQSVTKTVEGRRDALWEDLHTVLCTMALPLARWADSVCVTTMLRTPPLLSLSMHQLNGFTMSKGVNWKKCLFFFLKRLLIWSEINVSTIYWRIILTASRGRRSFRSRHVLCGARFSFQEKMSFI